MQTTRRTVGAALVLITALLGLVGLVAVSVAANEPDDAPAGADGSDATAALIGQGAQLTEGPPVTGPPDALETGRPDALQTGRLNPVTRISDPVAGAIADGAFTTLGTAYHPLGVARVRVAIRSLDRNLYWNGLTGHWQSDFVEVDAHLESPGSLHVFWSYRLPVDPPDGEYRVRAWAESVTGNGGQLGPLRDFSVRVPATAIVDDPEAIVALTPLSCDVARSDDGTTAALSVTPMPNDNAFRYVFERSRNDGQWYWAGRADVPVTSFTDADLHAQDDYRYRVRARSDSQDNSWPITCLEPDPERTAAVNEALAAFARDEQPGDSAAEVAPAPAASTDATDPTTAAAETITGPATTGREPADPATAPTETITGPATTGREPADAPTTTITAEVTAAPITAAPTTTTVVTTTQRQVEARAEVPATTTTVAPTTTAAPTTTVAPTTTLAPTTTTTAAPAVIARTATGSIDLAPPGTGVLMGVWAASTNGRTDDATRRSDIETFEAQIARRDMDIAHMFRPAHDQVWKVDRANWMLSNDQIPMISWKPGPTTRPTAGDQIGQQVVDGRFDADIRARAREAKQINGPVFSRLFHEMEGADGRAYDLTPELFVQFWRHVHDIFEAEGVDNVVWAWTPAVFERTTDVSAWYPGDAYVDWIGVDPYLWIGDTQGSSPCRIEGNFGLMTDRIGPKFWAFAASHPDKPVMLGEWGAGFRTGTTERERFIDSVGVMLAQRPQVKALVYFHSNHDQHCRWRLDEGSPAGADAFRRLVNDPRWAVNTGALIDGAR